MIRFTSFIGLLGGPAAPRPPGIASGSIARFVLACIASTTTIATTVRAQHIELPWPAIGEFAIESRFEKRALTDEQRRRSLAHCVAAIEEKEKRLEEKPYPGSRRAYPSPLRLVPKRDESFRRSESWLVAGPDFLHVGTHVKPLAADLSTAGGASAIDIASEDGARRASEPASPPSSTTRTVIRTQIQRGDDLIVWSEIDGVRGPTERHVLEPDGEAWPGSLYIHRKAIETLAVLAGHPERRSCARDHEPEKSLLECFEVDLSSAPAWELSPFAPLEAVDVLGVVRVSVYATDSGRALETEWLDTLGALVRRTVAEWAPDAMLPTSLSGESFAPGIGVLVSTSDVHAIRLSSEVDSRRIAWTPRPGESVVDCRLPVPKSYRVGEDGRLPDSLDLLASSVRFLELMDGGSDDEPWRKLDVDTAEHRAVGLSVPWNAVDLGSVPLGASRRVEFEIRNTGSNTVDFGPIEKDCGCLDARMVPKSLGPGQLAKLSVSRQVSAVGMSEARVFAPIEGPAGERLEFVIRATGRRGPIALPDPIVVERVRCGEDLSFRVHVLANGCVPEGGVPGCEVSGATVSDSRWTYDQARRLWTGEVRATPVDRVTLGLLEHQISITAPSCPDALCRIPLVFQRIPADVVEAWPDCLVLMSDRVERVELAFPVEIRGLGEDGGALDRLALDVALEPAASGSILRLTSRGTARGSPRESGIATLDSVAGPVRLKIVRHGKVLDEDILAADDR
jgi:hypothetical protein